MSPFERVIAAAGTQAKLAEKLGLTNQAISNWKRDGIPPERCPAVEAATGVPCEELRPELDWTRDEAGLVTGYHVPLSYAA